MFTKFLITTALVLTVVIVVGCQRQPLPAATPSPTPPATVPSPAPTIEPALLDDGLDDALKELNLVE